MKIVESFVTHEEEEDIAMEVDHDSREGTTGTHNG